MAGHRYEGSGDAFLGDQLLGRADLSLVGLETVRGRQADGAILFEDSLDHEIIGNALTFISDDGYGPFELVVTAIRNGRTTVAANGPMPWWP